MNDDDRQEPFRNPTDAYRLEAMGFHVAGQVITSDAQARAERDEAFRRDLLPLRTFLRPHVFSDRAARDSACASPMPGGVFAREPRPAGELDFRWNTRCLFAIRHGIDDRGFEEVASTIADPEMASLVERCGRIGTAGAISDSNSMVLSVSGALYQLLIVEDGDRRSGPRPPSAPSRTTRSRGPQHGCSSG